MYSDKENVLQLVGLLKAHGISRVVLAPGSRNAPIIHSLVSDGDFTCYSIVDERSAGFFALGLIQSTGQPVAVCCTSGTAVLNLASPVAEAYYQQLPLVVITADRPAAWIDQLEGQTVRQAEAFRPFIQKSVQLPEPVGEEEAWHCNRLINEALLELNHRGGRPVHINVPLSEPLSRFDREELPEARVIRRTAAPAFPPQEAAAFGRQWQGFGKRMIVIGQLRPGELPAELLERLDRTTDCVILTEQLSNTHPADAITNFDPLLYALPDDAAEAFAPDLLVTLGGHIVSKRVKQWLRSVKLKAHWHISPAGEVADTYQQVTEILEMPPALFVEALTETLTDALVSKQADTLPDAPKENPYRALWRSRSQALPVPQTGFSDLYAVGRLLESLPKQASLQIANSSSVRLAQLFPLPASVKVFCNRGTNGIDGSLSTAVGYAASNRLTFLLIGDLSFFYDMNGLWNRHVGNRLRILLNNNGCGEIFRTLPGYGQSEALEYIAGAHRTTAQPWAEQMGFIYLKATDEAELERSLARFIQPETDAPLLLEVFSSAISNSELLKSYYHQLKQTI
jgi:2-succinyl-5-enolpyruvyl-6-hydroxy-3-cyclohexene-1-carboxylate synthase